MLRRSSESYRLLSVVAFALISGACAPAMQPARPTAASEPVKDDKLRVDDVLEIRVVGEGEISGDYRVDPEGRIQFPYAGSVKVAGLDVEELRQILTARLKEEYLRNPQVAVNVKEWNSRKVSVLGEVAKPGFVPFVNGMTVVDAIAAAGGFTKSAATNTVKLRRQSGTQVETKECRVDDIGRGKAPNVSISPGDLIVVDERLF